MGQLQAAGSSSPDAIPPLRHFSPPQKKMKNDGNSYNTVELTESLYIMCIFSCKKMGPFIARILQDSIILMKDK